MLRELKLSIGQHSDKGSKPINQDFHGALIPAEPLLSLKGVAIAIADGISSSDVSHIASESAVKSLLTDYYCTSETWSVKTSVQRVLAAANSWLHSQSRRSQHPYDRDRGFVCTLTALVIKSNTAHLFHVGDCRVYRLNGSALEQLTIDHRVVISSEQTYLGRALGINPQLEIDYQTFRVVVGDIFVLATDGVYEHIDARLMVEVIRNANDDLDEAARAVVHQASLRGSDDNLTVQIVRVDGIPDEAANEVITHVRELPPPPLLDARMIFDGYRIVREIHGSSRSHIYLAVDTEADQAVAIKIPSIDQRDDTAYLKRFIMEEWIARRIDSPHVLKPVTSQRRRSHLYVVTEFIDGQTLAQWMIDNPEPELETVRAIIEQIAKGLRAFHRMEMLHQDLRPENIMIDKTGTVKIIDFGSVLVPGVAETAVETGPEAVLGTEQYAAPEYLLGEGGSPRADLFSLAVITYQMLTGKLPYGAQVARLRTKAQLRKLQYRTASNAGRAIPPWVDGALQTALHPDPRKRYETLTEYVFDLRYPNPSYLRPSGTPLIERSPTLFWKCTTIVLTVIIVVMLAGHQTGRW
jgi:serine/threonine protein phosphatase PrpC